MIRFLDVLWLAAAILLGSSLDARAETIAATQGYATSAPRYSVDGYPYGATPLEACHNRGAGLWLDGPMTCTNGQNYWASVVLSCAVGNWNGTTCVASTLSYMCPATGGWTLSGSQCTRPDCVAPLVRLADGTCGGNCTAGQSVPNMCWNGGLTTPLSYAGCAIECNGMAVAMGGRACADVCKQTGAQPAGGAVGATTNAPVADAPPTPESCLKQGKGYITNSSGTTVCLSAGSAPNLETQVKDAGTKTTTDASGTTAKTTGKTVTQSCDGAGNCNVTVTTTTTTTVNGGTPTVTTQQDEQTRSSFCEENPTASICGETKDECEEHPERLGCLKAGTVEDSAVATQSIGTSSVVAVSVPGNNACPADIALPHGLSFSYTPICDALGWFRPLVLALAWLGAGYIVFGVKQS